MKTLLILRHAHSPNHDPRIEDFARPLSARGRADAVGVGQWLHAQHLVPDHILSSAALRARTTAQIVAEQSGCPASPALDDALYNAPLASYLAALSELEAEPACVLVVGHNPGLETLLYTLARQDEGLHPASLAYLTLPLPTWGALRPYTRGTLHALRHPAD